MRVLSPEDEFFFLWEEYGGPPLERQYRFHPDRKWQSDFACLLTNPQLIIEIEGGVWKMGRHNRPKGYLNDIVKYNAAALLGFTLIRLSPDMVTEEYIRPVIEWCRERL